MKVDLSNPHGKIGTISFFLKAMLGPTFITLAELGFFDIERSKTLSKWFTIRSCSHVENAGVEFSTGSLGHGLPVAGSIAKSLNFLREKIMFSLLATGSCEGSNWEAVLFAAHHKLNNLGVLVDRNRLQSIKDTEET